MELGWVSAHGTHLIHEFIQVILGKYSLSHIKEEFFNVGRKLDFEPIYRGKALNYRRVYDPIQTPKILAFSHGVGAFCLRG